MNEETTKPSSVPNLKRAFKKSIGVFKTEFAVVAAFCVFAFLAFAVTIILDNLPSSQSYHRFTNITGYIALPAIIGILASMLCAFYTKKKLVQIICGAAGIGIAILLLKWEELFFRSSYKYLGIFVTLVFLTMHKFYSGEKKGESLLFVVAKFFNSVILTLPFILLAFAIASCFDNSFETLVEVVVFFFISFSLISMFYFLSHVHTDCTKNTGVSDVEEGLYYALPIIIFIVCTLLQYLFLMEDIFLHKFWQHCYEKPLTIVASVCYIYVYSITKSNTDKFSKIFRKVAGIALLPLIIIQLILLCKPYSTFGLTGSRICFLAYFVAVFVFIAISFFKIEKCTEKVYLIAAVIVFILLVQPFGAEKLGMYCQKVHLESYLIKKGIFDKKTLTIAKDWEALNLSKEDELVIEGSYMYLNCKNFNYKNAIPDFCKQEDFKKNIWNLYENE